jgi:hypothetical protein
VVRRPAFVGAGLGLQARLVLELVVVREWLFRRAGSGCEPVALDAESFPVCPLGPRPAVPRWPEWPKLFGEAAFAEIAEQRVRAADDARFRLRATGGSKTCGA